MAITRCLELGRKPKGSLEMSRVVREVDWETYDEVFPDRYLEPSAFDEKVKKEALAAVFELLPQGTCGPGPQLFVDVLDIGGGKSGTRHIQHHLNKCWLLDPFVEGAPDWMEGKVDWDTDKKFKLIVCRGSFNYLQRQQIMKIPSMLKRNGVFIFNTFFQAKNGARKYRNSKSGVEGREIFQWRGDYIVHRLEPAGEDYAIQHKIKIRSVENIVELLGASGLSFEFLGSNTLFVRLENKSDG